MVDRPAGWPLAAVEATARQGAGGAVRKVVSLRDDLTVELIRVPAGASLAGDMDYSVNGGSAPRRVAIDRAFWMGAREITNRQYREFDRSHDSGYSRDFRFRLPVTERQGRPLNEPDQPVVRVTWSSAIAFCGWLSARTGLRVSLPTELQWEYACRAGTATAFSFGDREVDFSAFANFADNQLWGLGDPRFNDHAIVTVPVGRYQPNPWGLHDMHGNAAEWTLSESAGGKVIRGGSFYDRPDAGRSAARLAYPEWRRVHDVGFRIVCELPDPEIVTAGATRGTSN
jgi:formylglycine-generating enzyme required for sulfatase activity